MNNYRDERKDQYTINVNLLISCGGVIFSLIFLFYYYLRLDIKLNLILSVVGGILFLYLVIKHSINKTKKSISRSNNAATTHKLILEFEDKYNNLLDNHKRYIRFIRFYPFVPILCLFLIFISKFIGLHQNTLQAIFAVLLLVSLFSIGFAVVFTLLFLINYFQKSIYRNFYVHQILELKHSISENEPTSVKIDSDHLYSLLEACYLAVNEENKKILNEVLIQTDYHLYISNIAQKFSETLDSYVILEKFQSQNSNLPKNYFLLGIYLLLTKYRHHLNYEHILKIDSLSHVFAYLGYIETKENDVERLESLKQRYLSTLRLLGITLKLHAHKEDTNPHVDEKFITNKNLKLSRDLENNLSHIFKFFNANELKELKAIDRFSGLLPVEKKKSFKDKIEDSSINELKNLYNSINVDLFLITDQKMQIILEIYHYIEEQVSLVPHHDVLLLQQARLNTTKKLKAEISMYLSIPKEDRLKHNITIKAIPNFYLNRVICEIHEDLLKDIEKVHLKGLNTMLDHQKFIEQRINAEQTWNIDTKD